MGGWCVVSAVSVVGRWLGVCVCGTWLCGEKKKNSGLSGCAADTNYTLYSILMKFLFRRRKIWPRPELPQALALLQRDARAGRLASLPARPPRVRFPGTRRPRAPCCTLRATLPPPVRSSRWQGWGRGGGQVCKRTLAERERERLGALGSARCRWGSCCTRRNQRSRSSRRTGHSGVPRPVTVSKPVAAGKPVGQPGALLLPSVMSVPMGPVPSARAAAA